MRTFPWSRLLGGDPRPWLLDSDQPAARWVTLSQVYDRPDNDPDVVDARRRVLDHAGTRELLDRLPDWEAGGRVSGHNSPAFAPNLLNLLADLGVRRGDDRRIEHLLDRMLAHSENTGRLPSYAASRAGGSPVWGALLCDSHAIVEVLVRFGRGDDPRVRAALDRMGADLCDTAQGPAWPCIPHPVTGFRGPGRRGDFCPQVTLEALRTFARLPATQHPAGLLAAARVALRAWRVRAAEKPYMFGHGRQFKTTKWPVTWYCAEYLLDTLGRYPGLWQGARADPDDRRALAEIVACLIAFNVGPDGTVTPRSTYRGFEKHSFGQKTRPSPVATAWLLAVLHRFDDLAADAASVDVFALPSSKGKAGLCPDVTVPRGAGPGAAAGTWSSR